MGKIIFVASALFGVAMLWTWALTGLSNDVCFAAFITVVMGLFIGVCMGLLEA